MSLFSRAKGKTARAADAGPPGRLDPYGFEATHRRLAWMLRFSAMFNVLLFVGLGLTLSTIVYLVPLKQTEYALVRTYGPDDRLYRIEPIAEDVDGFELLLESTARRYVRLVLEIDAVTQEERSLEAAGMTGGVLRERIYRERIESGLVAEALKRGLQRDVSIESVDRIESFDNDHKLVVDFVQRDTEWGRELPAKKLRAYLTMVTRPGEVAAADRYVNPLGLFVTGFVLKERET